MSLSCGIVSKAVGFPSAGLPSSCAELSERAMSLYPDPSGAPRNGFGASAWASAIMIRLAIGLSFDWKYRGVHTGLHFRLAHSFVGLGFCASVALRTASLPISMPLSLLSSFLSFYKFSQALLGAPYNTLTPRIQSRVSTLNVFRCNFKACLYLNLIPRRSTPHEPQMQQPVV